jgi:hypothetical protein
VDEESDENSLTDDLMQKIEEKEKDADFKLASLTGGCGSHDKQDMRKK